MIREHVAGDVVVIHSANAPRAETHRDQQKKPTTKIMISAGGRQTDTQAVGEPSKAPLCGHIAKPTCQEHPNSGCQKSMFGRPACGAGVSIIILCISSPAFAQTITAMAKVKH